MADKRALGWVALALALAAVTLGWWRAGRSDNEGDAAQTSVAASAPASTRRASPAVAARPDALASAPLLAMAAASAVLPQVKAATLDPGQEREEVCGHGLLSERDVARLFPREVQMETQQRLADSLRHGSEREQALAHVLGLVSQLDRVQANLHTLCGEDMTCQVRVSNDPRLRPSGRHSADLVALAQRSLDPWVYALTVAFVCRFRDPAVAAAVPGCQSITPQGWQARAPDDAGPYLWQASLAARRKDEASVQAALQQAAQLPKLSSDYFAVHQPLWASPAWQSLKPLERTQELASLIGVSAAFVQDMFTPRSYCLPVRPGDAQQAQTCDGLVRLFTAESASMLHHGMGTRIAAARGWPVAQLKPLQDTSDAFATFQAGRFPVSEPMFSCSSIARLETRLRDTAALGEVGALRKAMQTSGKSFEEWASSGREQRLMRELAQAQAASAPR